MQYLFKIGFFNFDYVSIISFIVGVFLGAMLLALIYATLVLISLRNEKYGIKSKELDLDEKTVNEYIKTAQTQYKDKELRKEKGKVGFCFEISENLATKIATHYFPNSKTPLFELTVDELMDLTLYVEKRVEELLNRKGIRLLKKLKVSDIVAISKKTNNVVNSKLFKVTKEVNEKALVARKILNVINPAWWVKKGVIDTSLAAVTNKICLIIISIVGEETYKIYSKKIFEYENNEDNMEDLVNGIETKLISAVNEIKNIDTQENTCSNQDNKKYKLKTKVFAISNDFIKKDDIIVYNTNNKLKEYNEKTCNTFVKLRKKMEEN